MKSQNKPTVVITSAIRWNYFYWFLLGFYELKREHKIDFKFRISKEDWLFANRYRGKIGKILHVKKSDKVNLNGYVSYPDGRKKYFCIDCQDSPFVFHAKDLEKVNCYFKMQCPIDIDKDYFPLTEKIHIPWLDHAHKDESIESYDARGERKLCEGFEKNRQKIRPLMIGPRRLSTGISYLELKRGYDHYIHDRKINKDKKLMCYFGSAKGPVPREHVTTPDYSNEQDIMGYFGDVISHPNEKRAKAAQIMFTIGGGEYDARVISENNSDTKSDKDRNLFVPLKDFCGHIAKFQYNLNVSGYRRSIPNRFIESFMVGTGIVTDKLAVKWYLPFDKEEVIETVEMGYLRNSDVDWKSFERDLENLPKSDPEKIIACFEEKWAPKKVAEYMMREINNS